MGELRGVNQWRWEMVSRSSPQVSPSERVGVLFSRLISRIRFTGASGRLLKSVLKEAEIVNLELETLLRYTQLSFKTEAKSPIPLSEVLKGVLDILGDLARRGGHYIICSLREDILVDADRQALESALVALLLSAMEAVPGAHMRICLERRDSQALVFISTYTGCFVCSKEGGGIRPPLFRPAGQPFPGLLSYAAHLIKAHRGFLSTVRGPQGDVSFLVILPQGGPLSPKEAVNSLTKASETNRRKR